MTLTVFRRTSQVFCRRSLNCDLSDVFLIIRLKVICFGEDHRGKVPFLSHHINYQHDWSLFMLTLITWLEVIFVRFLHGRVTLFFPPPFPYCHLWKKFTICSPHLRSGELCLTSLRVEYQIFSFSPTSQSFIYICMDRWIFVYTMGYNPILLYLFCCSLLL